jgi:hypothetical protein
MRNVTGSKPKQIILNNGVLRSTQQLFEEIRGHEFFRGVELTISLANLARAYEVSSIENKYICFVICQLCETGQFRMGCYV